MRVALDHRLASATACVGHRAHARFAWLGALISMALDRRRSRLRTCTRIARDKGHELCVIGVCSTTERSVGQRLDATSVFPVFLVSAVHYITNDVAWGTQTTAYVRGSFSNASRCIFDDSPPSFRRFELRDAKAAGVKARQGLASQSEEREQCPVDDAGLETNAERSF